MIKALFVIGQCIRLLHQDPWQSPSYLIKEVGKYSYRVESNSPATSLFYRPYADPITFEQQKTYEVVTCSTPTEGR
jgi:hypothetical protein